MNITPDLRQNIFVTAYLLFSHNYIALAYFIGLLIGIGLAIYRPSRYATFILLSFAILLFSYEYDKHIIDALREQTIKSLITINPHFRVQRVVNLVLTEIAPIFLYVAGWSLLFISVIWGGIHLGNKSKDKISRLSGIRDAVKTHFSSTASGQNPKSLPHRPASPNRGEQASK